MLRLPALYSGNLFLTKVKLKTETYIFMNITSLSTAASPPFFCPSRCRDLCVEILLIQIQTGLSSHCFVLDHETLDSSSSSSCCSRITLLHLLQFEASVRFSFVECDRVCDLASPLPLPILLLTVQHLLSRHAFLTPD
ncbi:hypothetical protein INR49_032689 [Caranx melampygus]|nr:hypothetical protein INR49_032689 [Caranx melampygus]